MGLRGNFAEGYSGKSLQGSYLSGIYYPDKTKVGWWKNGYPEYFAKIPNAVNWIGADIYIGDAKVDLHTARVDDFECILDMKHGILTRTCVLTIEGHGQLKLSTERFCSFHQKEVAGQRLRIDSIDIDASLSVESYLDFNVMNAKTNYDEVFWDHLGEGSQDGFSYVQSQTRKTAFTVMAGMNVSFTKNGTTLTAQSTVQSSRVNRKIVQPLRPGEFVEVTKLVYILQSMYIASEDMIPTMKSFFDVPFGVGI